MTARRFRYVAFAVAVLAAGAGLGLALSGADTPARGPLVLFFLAVAPAVAIGGLLRDLDPAARLIIAVTAALALDYLVAETMLAAGAWSPTAGLVAVLVIVAACFALRIPAVRGRLHTSVKASQTLARRVAAASAAVGGSRPRGRWIRLAVLVAVVLLAAAAGVALPGRDGAGQSAPHRPPVVGGQAVRAQTAGWVLAQVSRATIVSCDPLMCADLQHRGFPAGNLDVLRPGTSDLLDSEVTVATGVLRSQFGSRLTSVYAPTVLASFGSGSTGIQVRAVAPDGAPAYLHELSADVAARKSFGGQLVHNTHLVIGPVARRQLAQGRVDARLIVVIGTVARSHRLHIVSFGDASRGASAGVPLRSALLSVRPGRTPSVTALHRLRSFLEAQQPPYLPAVAKVTRLAAGHALKVQFAVPDPLGLLAPRGAAGA